MTVNHGIRVDEIRRRRLHFWEIDFVCKNIFQSQDFAVHEIMKSQDLIIKNFEGIDA
jgi:phage-related protein